MPNYQFLDAYGSVLSAGSSIIGGVNYPQVYVQGSITGTVNIGTISGSVVSFQGGTSSPSALGYIYRNDTLSSTLGADLTYHPAIGDSAGRTIIKPFVADDSATFRFSTSVVSGSVTLVQASAIGKRSYVTDITAANSSGTFTLVTLQDGSTSILGYLPAPATSGAIPQYTILPRTAPGQDLTFKISPAVSVLSITINGYQSP